MAQPVRCALMGDRLVGKRVLVTSCDSYMGPPIVELFRSEGATVIADPGQLTGATEPDELLSRSGELDVLVVNLDIAAYVARVRDIDDDHWLAGFDAMVHPLMRLVRAATQPMIDRGGGSIVAVTSSSPLRRMRPQAISYVTARAAQNAFVRSAGHELAAHNVRLNAIAQNFVENDTYYPPAIMDNAKFRDRLQAEVPAQRLGTPRESAELALFLASDASTFTFGQVISADGGWS
jgi:2-keto-3-deoxy-L-fuconate dehydrogenase